MKAFENSSTPGTTAPKDKRRIAIFLSDLEGGGAQRITVNLLKGFSPQLFDLDLVLISATGPFLGQVPKHVNVIDLKASSVTTAIRPLARYLRRSRPVVLMSHLSHVNVGALLARRLAGTRTKVVLVEHNNLSSAKRGTPRRFRLRAAPQRRLLPRIMRFFYRQADAVVGVSEGVSGYVGKRFKVPKARVHTIYNPIVDDELLKRSDGPPEHPWLLEAQPPTLIAVGRLTTQKDFPTLLRAFAEVRQKRDCRLIIFGEGSKRADLGALAKDLGVSEEVSLPGFTQNPYAAMNRAALFVLSSRWEGLPTVLVEAMACGCPVVATDCPSGPNEILEGGRYGRLVPVGDAQALADAILQTLETPLPKEVLRARAADFSYSRAVDAYTRLLNTL